MKKRTIEEYYLGLDIGTNSVGYAVTAASVRKDADLERPEGD